MSGEHNLFVYLKKEKKAPTETFRQETLLSSVLGERGL